MNSQSLFKFLAVILTSCACCVQSLLSAPVTLGNFAANGSDTTDTITLNSNLGGTRTYGTYSGAVYDGGINTAISSTTLASVGDEFTYSFTLATPTVNGDVSNTFRSGFALYDGASAYAHLHFITAVGTSTDARFAANTNNNRYSGGTQVGATTNTFFNNSSLRFDDGNTVNVTFTLKLTADNITSYDFLYTVNWSNGSFSNSVAQAFTGIATNKIVGMYHLTNQVLITSGTSWTVSNAAANFSAIPEPSSYAALAGLGILGFAAMRRRRERF
ncbi:MAG: hypothetical protein RL376_505 [Verrucomicrobiota bacterium]|jgi:hypothetical protein